MSGITIILFFLYTYFLGYTATFFLKKQKNFLETHLTMIGIGLGILPVFLVLLSFFKVPLDWRIILGLTAIMPLYSLFKFFKSKPSLNLKLKIKKSDLYILGAVILFSLSLFMYVKGAFIYPYLENDDPWSHANGVKYVSIEKTAFNPNGGTSYLDPYPPAYDVLLGLMHQTSPEINWTMKFFNALIISLSILFFYFFTKKFIGSRKKALFATFIFASIPCYLSHFIWAHALIPPLIILAFYSLEMIRHDKKYMYIAALIIASIFLTQPSQPIKFSIMFMLYFIIKFIYSRKESFLMFFSGASGFLVSLIWWSTRWRSQFGHASSYDFEKGGLASADFSTTFFDKIMSFLGQIKRAFDPRTGSATRVYNFDDFFVAKHQNMINNPTGVGIFICVLVFLSLIFIILYLFKEINKNKTSKIRYYLGMFLLALSSLLTLLLLFFRSLILFAYTLACLILAMIIVKNNIEKKENKGWLIITLLWTLFTYLGINSLTFNLPVGLFGFRFWMLFAIPIAIFSVIGAWFIFDISKKFKLPKILILILILVLVFFTSASQKYSVNTANWPPGAFWTSYDEINGYVWLKQNLAPNTKVFTFVNNGAVVGMNMYACNWCPDVRDYMNQGFNETPEQNYDWLKKNQYEYMIIDGQTMKKFGINESNKKLQDLASSGKFQLTFNNNGFLIFKVI